MRIGNESPRKHTALKVLTATTVATAGVVTTLALAKKGKLNPVEGGNKAVETLKATLKTPADKALNFIAGSKTITKVVEKIGEFQSKIAPKVKNFKEGVLEYAETFATNVEAKAKAFAQKDSTKKVIAKAQNLKERFLADFETFITNADTSIKNFTQKFAKKA